jgi:nucleoside-diphosphate kinase
MKHTHPKHERTLVIIKPDGIQRNLIGEIIGRYERLGLKLVGMKMTRPTIELIEKHYNLDPEWVISTGKKSIAAAEAQGRKALHSDPQKMGEHILRRLSRYVTAGPVIALVWEGLHVIPIVRKITGGTEPLTSDVGTIRGDFVLDSYEFSNAEDRAIRNLVHASSSVSDAEKEIDLWFKKDELINYRHIQDKILYDVNLDGIFE